MNFIAGSISTDHSARARIAEQLVTKLAATDELVSSFSTDSLSFFSSGSKTSPVLRSSDGSMLAVFGTLLLPSGHTCTDSVRFEQEFVTGMRSGAIAFLRGCDGAFCFAFYDSLSRSLYLGNDAFGGVALYYSAEEESFAFCTCQRALGSSVGEVPAENSVLSYIGFQQTFGEQTFYRSVKRLKNASLLTWSLSDGLKTTRYYTPSYEHIAVAEVPALVLEIETQLLRSTERTRNAHASLGAALTGGFDSRVTLGLLRNLGYAQEMEFFTHGLPDSNDILVAKQIAREFGLRHHICEFDDALFAATSDRFRETIDMSEGGLGTESSPVLASWEAQGKLFDTIIDSQGGPMYRRQILRARLPSIEREGNIAQGIFKWMASAAGGSSFVRAEVREEARKVVQGSLERYFATLPEGMHTGDKIDRFYVDELCANREALTGNLQLQFLRFAHPMFSIEAFERVSRVPVSERNRNIIYRTLIDRLLPEAKRFPLDNSGYLVNYRGFRWKRYLPRLYERVIGKLGPEFGSKHALRKPSISPEAIVSAGRRQISKILHDYSDLLEPYFDVDSISNAVAGVGITDAELLSITNVALLLRYLRS